MLTTRSQQAGGGIVRYFSLGCFLFERSTLAVVFLGMHFVSLAAMERLRRAVIIGGGPGGLAAARALRAAGFAVTVIECDHDNKRVGVGITLWPNGTDALDQLGAFATLRSKAATMTSMALRTDRDRLLFALDLNAELDASPRYPSLTLTRAALIDCLREGLQEVIVDGTAVSFSLECNSVVVKLKDGRRVEADYLVGADGERSMVRRQLFGRALGRHAGYLVWRGVARIQPYGSSAICWLGKGIQFGAFPLPGGETYWFATTLVAFSSPQAVDQKAALGVLFADWPNPIREIIRTTDAARLVLTHPFAYSRLQSWTRGPVALVGDAAHPLEPTLGQGACLAFEDAVVLAQSLKEHALDAAGAYYVAARLHRANELAARAHAFGRSSTWRGVIACGLRNFAIAVTPGSLHRSQIASMSSWRGAT
jgi:2-polyprenyl-6-methoxyphenol hydroxylase-like FAD-dependent oxidoreductase